MFSAVTSAFIIQIGSQLQPDPNDETAALLRVLIYKIDNTTFGPNVPTLPHWTGPPRAIVQVQATLYASLAISFFSAFLAMLGKQWLASYDSADVRGSIAERGQNRQRKLGGIVWWKFGYVMESLPLMLQAALLLFGCALSRYLWEVDVTTASVVVGVTSLGVIFYIFIIIAGTASDSCPYQTPHSRILRHLSNTFYRALRHTLCRICQYLPYVRHLLPHAIAMFIQLIRLSIAYHLLSLLRRESWQSRPGRILLVLAPIFMPVALAFDAFVLSFAIPRACLGLLAFVCLQACYWFYRVGRGLVTGTFSRTPTYDNQTIALDLQCISWILQTSVDKRIQLLTLKRLIQTSAFSHFHPSIVIDCFNVFTGYVSVGKGKAVVVQGSGRLAMDSASALFDTLQNLILMDPTSNILEDLHRRYNAIISPDADFAGLPFDSTISPIHTFSRGVGTSGDLWQGRPSAPGQGHIPFSQHIAKAAQEKYQQTQRKKVPRWALRSACHLLSLGSVSPPSTIADCLMVIAIDIGCNVSEVKASNERCVCVWHAFTFLTTIQCASGAILEAHYSATRKHGSRPTFKDPHKEKGHQRVAPIRDLLRAEWGPKDD